MTTKFEPIKTIAGKAGGAFEGRTFVQSVVFRAESAAVLKEVGAEQKGPGSFLLPQGSEADTAKLVERLTATAKADHAQLLKDRAPVAADKAPAIGDEFDFGGSVGKATVAGVGQAFTAKASGVDERLAAFDGQETVYVYNANAPKSAQPKPELSDEEKAARAAARAEAAAVQVAERDKTRVIVKAGSVEEGGKVTVGGVERDVTGLGKAFEIKDKAHAAELMTRFEDAPRLKAGDTVQYAQFDPEPENELHKLPEPTMN